MRDKDKTKEQLISELVEMRQRIGESETSETQGKQAEEAVREAERRYRAIFDNRLHMVYVNNEQGLFLDANDYALERLGYARDDLGKLSLRDVLHPEDLPKTLEAVADVLAKGFMEHPVELRVITKSGETMWVETFGVPVEWGVDHFIGLGIARDITDRKRVEEALRRQEEYFRSLIENASDAIVILNGDGTIRYQSPSYERVLGYTPEEEIARDMFDNIHPDDATDVADGLARLLEHPGEIIGVEVRARHRDGSWHTLETTANNLLHDPAVEGIVVNFRDITDRKQAEEALRDSEQKYRHLFENLNDAVFLADVETGHIIETNKQAEVLLGRIREEIIGMHQRELHPAEKAEEYRHRFATHIEKGHAADYDGEVVTKDGSIVPVTISAAPLTIGGKRLILGLFRDVTERKRAEEVLRESEARYRLLAENASDVIWTIDMNMRRTYVSPSVTRLRGYSVEEAMTQTLDDLLTPASVDIAKKALEDALAIEGTGQQQPAGSRTMELEMSCKDGSTVWTEISVTFLRDPDGQPTGIIGASRDITQRKRTEEVLRESEARYRLLAENITDVISCVDMNGQPTYMSPSVTRLLGFSVEEAMAHSLEEDGVTPASREVASKALARQLAVENDGQAGDSKWRPVELEFYRKDGSTVWVEIAVSFLRDSDGRSVEILTVLRDVSERKRLDEERERLLRELAEKTRELEQIVFVASHDLRSPLVNIQGFTRELEQSLEEVRSVLESEETPSVVKDKLAVPVNQDIPDAFRYILASSAKIDSLLSGLLRLSRLGRAALIIEKLDMNGLMADVARAFEFLVKEAGTALEVEDLPPCHGDKTQVNQVFSNLVDNALKFLQPSRAGIIRVSGRSEDGRAIYCVEDNGIGIAPEHQERVFEIFQRLDPSANSGEGLGLAIVRRILERHAGKAWVESEPGKGSKFFVSLPSV